MDVNLIDRKILNNFLFVEGDIESLIDYVFEQVTKFLESKEIFITDEISQNSLPDTIHPKVIDTCRDAVVLLKEIYKWWELNNIPNSRDSMKALCKVIHLSTLLCSECNTEKNNAPLDLTEREARLALSMMSGELEKRELRQHVKIFEKEQMLLAQARRKGGVNKGYPLKVKNALRKRARELKTIHSSANKHRIIELLMNEFTSDTCKIDLAGKRIPEHDTLNDWLVKYQKPEHDFVE